MVSARLFCHTSTHLWQTSTPTMRPMELRGRHVVVTGAAGGIGGALATRFHAEGANVVLSDVAADAVSAVAAGLEAGRAGSAVAVPADIGTEDGNRMLVRAAEDAFGPNDLYFANAGVGTGGGPEAPEAEWRLAFDVNLHAHRWAAKYL